MTIHCDALPFNVLNKLVVACSVEEWGSRVPWRSSGGALGAGWEPNVTHQIRTTPFHSKNKILTFHLSLLLARGPGKRPFGTCIVPVPATVHCKTVPRGASLYQYSTRYISQKRSFNHWLGDKQKPLAALSGQYCTVIVQCTGDTRSRAERVLLDRP